MKQTVISHLEELRKRLIIIAIVFFILFTACFFLSDFIINFIKDNLLINIKVIVISPFEIILTKLNITLFLAMFLTIPLIFYQFIVYLKPGLKKNEYKILFFSMFFFILLFFTGIIFCYFILLKIGIFYLAKLAMNIDIGNYWSFSKIISFIFVSCLALGFIFELPLMLIVLRKLNLVNYETLKAKRSYLYLISFILAAIITSPDPVTQILVAFPIIILYEISLLIIRII